MFTEGSTTRAVINGGAGVLIIHPSGRKLVHHSATGKHCSNYRAEIEALKQAVSLIEDSTEKMSSVVFFTDVKSVLEALLNNKVPQLAQPLSKLSTNGNVALQ